MKKMDLIEAYKIITGKEGIGSSKFFTVALNDHCLRGNQFKFYLNCHLISTSVEIFSPKDFSTIGTDFLRMLWRRPPSVHSRKHWMTTWQT